MVSAEHLIQNSTGPIEARKIAEAIKDKPGITNYLAPESEWECLWAELIVHNKGARTSLVRGGVEREYNFSEEMLNAMILEYNRLIAKYSSPGWNWKPTAVDLVQYLNDHLIVLQQELIDVQTGVRVLSHDDFLGPSTRRKMGEEAQRDSSAGRPVLAKSRDLSKDKNDYSDYFLHLEKKLSELRRSRRIEGIMSESE